jgi:uncharacterized protein (DUF302 family)
LLVEPIAAQAPKNRQVGADFSTTLRARRLLDLRSRQVMSDYGRRIVVDAGFDRVVGTLNIAMRAEGLQPLAQVDVRDHFAREQSHDFRRYVLVQGWSPEVAMEALRQNLDAGTMLAAVFVVYELGDGETVVVGNPPLAAFADDYQWQRLFPTLASLAHSETQRVARVMDRIETALKLGGTCTEPMAATF